MTTIYLIRHGEAEGNLYRRAQGHWDGKITALGKTQIDALSARFADTHIDAVFSSDLSRAKETAGAFLRGRDLSLATTARLREVCMGVWEGRPWGELQHEWAEQMSFFNNDPAKWSVPGSESFGDAQLRMTETIASIAKEHDGESIAIVSHGMAIKIFLMGVMGVKSGDPETMMHGDNTSVSLLKYDGGKFAVEYYNDNSHLGENTSTFAKQKWWRKNGPDLTSLRFERLDPFDGGDAELYLRCYGDSWRAAHGSERGFSPGVYLASAKNHFKEAPDSLMKVMSGDELAGVIELDPERGRREKRGWITLFYLKPEYRGVGLGVQLLGYAVNYFDKRGRSTVRLHAAVTNEKAVAFYKRNGFSVLGVDSGVSSDQFLMERSV
ncbi:MAG: bifunctional histidine phosphatase family protein/GNAT family N-acetyltransferase [Oscillospiraceae bacterium]